MADVEIFYICHFHFASAKLKKFCKHAVFVPIFGCQTKWLTWNFPTQTFRFYIWQSWRVDIFSRRLMEILQSCTEQEISYGQDVVFLYFVNSLWPSDAIWRHISGTTLAQVRACCLTAPSHYLNHCLFIFKGVFGPSPRLKAIWYGLLKISLFFLSKVSLKVRLLKLFTNLPGAYKKLNSACKLALYLKLLMPWKCHCGNSYTGKKTSSYQIEM